MPPESTEKIKGRPLATFKSNLCEDPNVKLNSDDRALLFILLSQVFELLASERGTFSISVIEFIKSDAKSF